jgi:hypothetical protein
MKGHLNVIVFEPARLVYVLTPKCGSSSMINIFLTMAGFDPQDRGIRDLAWAATADGRLAAAGLHISRETPDSALRAADRRAGFRRLANIRNPYDRVLSNYYNKLNRYAKAHARGAFLYGKMRQLLEGPRAWPLVARGNAHMQARIGFEAMLNGLARHGVDFDAHYARQCDLLALDHQAFDRLFRLETLDQEFRGAMEAYGLPADMLDRVKAMPRNNKSAYGGREDALLTPAAKTTIAGLYAEDFARLGYSV